MNLIKIVTIFIISSLLTLSFIDIIPSCSAWSNGGYSSDPSHPDYGTHDWIAQHALDWLPSNEKQFILDNINTYLYGTELPDNNQASDGIGDTGNHHVYYHSNGTLQADNSARRASEEFNKTLDYLKASNYPAAAKEAGIMFHYLADIGVFAHVMGASTDWGAETHHSDYEDHVTNAMKSSTSTEFDPYLSFDGSLANKTAYSGALELARTSTFGDNQKVKTCSWMDDNYNWNSSTFKDSAGRSLNYAVNLVADVLHTLVIQAKYSGQSKAISHIFVNEMEFNVAGADDGKEWVELYNPDAVNVDLSGYYLVNNDGDTALLSGSVSAKGYLVKIFSSQYLDNTNEGLKLFDASDKQIDSTPIRDDDPSGSSYGDNNVWARCPDGTVTWKYQAATPDRTNGCNKPMAKFNLDQATGFAKTTTFTVDASQSTDPDNDIAEYQWAWGDGAASSGKTSNHQYQDAGNFIITLTVTDKGGHSDSTTKTATVQPTPNRAPVADFIIKSITGKHYSAYQVDASGSSDQDGDALNYTWTWGDGTASTGKTSSHEYSKAGTFTIKLNVSDGRGGQASYLKSVEVKKVETMDDATFWGICAIFIIIVIVIIICIFLAYRSYKKKKIRPIDQQYYPSLMAPVTYPAPAIIEPMNPPKTAIIEPRKDIEPIVNKTKRSKKKAVKRRKH